VANDTRKQEIGWRDDMDVTKILAYVGGITGPLGLLMTWLAYQRDAPRIRVTLQRGFRITQGPHDALVRQMLAEHKADGTDPPTNLYVRDPDKAWANLIVANAGRRIIRIEKIGWVPPHPGRFSIPGGYMGVTGWLPADLEEGDARDFPIEESQLAPGVLAAVAWDKLGRGHYGSFERSLRGLVLRIKVLFRIPPFG
jgi:hypothetical protein